MQATRCSYQPTSHDKKSNSDSTQTYDLLSSNQRDQVERHSLTLPRLAKGTTDGRVTKVQQIVSDYQYLKMPDVFSPSPLQMIPSEKFNGIPVCNEGLTIAKTDRLLTDTTNQAPRQRYELVAAHSDNFNSNHSVPARRAILALKYLSNNHQLYTVISYTRSSVDSILTHVEHHETIAKSISDRVKRFDYDRRIFGKHILDRGIRTGEGKPSNAPYFFPEMICVRTHMDPTVAYQGVLFSVVEISKKFELNLVELVALSSALEYSANCCYYFNSVAVCYILCANKRERTPNDGDDFSVGIHFGFKFLQACNQLFKKEREKNQGTLPVLFN